MYNLIVDSIVYTTLLSSFNVLTNWLPVSRTLNTVNTQSLRTLPKREGLDIIK